MRVIETRNAHEALRLGMKTLEAHGVRRESRVGDVLVADGPVTTLYQQPRERVVFWPERDANPFFHFMEGLWMIAGRNDVAWIGQFSSNIKQFSDDGVTFHGPYGYRWINHFVKNVGTEDDPEYAPFNQLEMAVAMLRENPDERRVVVGMWDVESDLGHKGKDIPCNTQIMFSINKDGGLDMTVCNRSNDIIWGAYGANVVHMSMLQEFMASAIGVPVGRYWQMSNNWHGYVDVFEKHSEVMSAPLYNPYESGEVHPFPMINGPIEEWLSDLLMFMDEGPVPAMRDRFFRKVVGPIWNAWWIWKDKDNPHRVDEALQQLSSCRATDWKRACEEWLERRR